ncbi:MAG: hypothetical protein KatS3mg105_0760 [Gemmatales bacterium]|nr:MAG: hypothetical protein KatS3mg105_0760 [Gemmatales bacterium]
MGESGTGKELIARLIHECSPRLGKRFVRVNCAALSESLIESELFGHEKGAFTGADQFRVGRFEWADGGTLLLDEIGELPWKLQAKLLRVLEDEEFERVGSNRPQKVDVRILATTNRNLAEEVAAGRFRSDLYYRLNSVHFTLPPLRSRREEIGPLARFFFNEFHGEAHGLLTGLAKDAIDRLEQYDWPGNVRQLRNVIRRACILAEGPAIGSDDIVFESTSEPTTAQPQTLAEIERRAILETLRQMNGNRTATAKRLGITTRTLSNKLKQYGHAA